MKSSSVQQKSWATERPHVERIQRSHLKPKGQKAPSILTLQVRRAEQMKSSQLPKIPVADLYQAQYPASLLPQSERHPPTMAPKSSNLRDRTFTLPLKTKGPQSQLSVKPQPFLFLGHCWAQRHCNAEGIHRRLSSIRPCTE